MAVGDFNGPLSGDTPRRAGGVAICSACPSEPTQLGRPLAVDGAITFVAACGAGAALLVACTALGQGGEGPEGDGGGDGEVGEAPLLQVPQAAAAPAIAPSFDTCSLEDFPALG